MLAWASSIEVEATDTDTAVYMILPMDDLTESQPQPGSNSPEMTVSELAGALKRTVEENYAFVRVRGELGRVVLAKSGHLYFDIKDEGATLNTIMWKGSAGKLSFKPEEGLEVVAEGRLSTYPGRSNYQMIAERMRPAGPSPRGRRARRASGRRNGSDFWGS